MAERFDCALSTARAVSRSSAFGLLFKRRERAAYPGSTVPGFAWGGAIEERDLTVGGASRSAVYPVRSRSLASEAVVFLYLDAIALRVRIANKVISVPVLVGLGVKEDGQKVILDLELFQSESSSCWEGFFEGLISRALKPPCLVIIDGNKGLRVAVEKNWPGTAVQRCTVHKLRNLERHAPRHALEEVKSDYHRIVYGESLEQAKKAYRDFISKWKKLAPKVVVSLEEAGDELLTFYRFPKSQWKSLRTTNSIERLNGEFRRRVKTQSSLPDARAAERLLFGLIISGQIQIRRIDGWRDLKQVSPLKAA